MENTGLISVIIPVYNVEKYLEECVESVLAQTYQKFEVLLINDGSTDSSEDICKRYSEKDERIKLINKKNGGASSARNLGLEIAEGEYIYFLDSDDWLHQETLENLIECSVKERADVVFFDAYTVEQDTGKISTSNYFHKHKYCSGTGYDVMGEMIRNKEFRVSPCLLFFNAEFLRRGNLRFEEGIMYEDMIFAYQVFSMADQVAYLPKFLYYRRYREKSVMTSKKSLRNFESAKTVYYKVKSFAEVHQVIGEETTKQYMARCSFNVLNLYKKLSLNEQRNNKESYKKLKEDILGQNAYGVKALQARCYGEILWFVYKVYEKVFLEHIKR